MHWPVPAHLFNIVHALTGRSNLHPTPGNHECNGKKQAHTDTHHIVCGSCARHQYQIGSYLMTKNDRRHAPLTWSKTIGYHGARINHDTNIRETWARFLDLPFRI
jgi:hypothetical protein